MLPIVWPWTREQVIPWRREERAAAPAANFSLAWAVMPMMALAQATPIEIRVAQAFEPLLAAIRAAGYPLLILYASAGTLVLLTGNRERGLRMLRDAGIGYLALQLVPTVAQLLQEVGAAMRHP